MKRWLAFGVSVAIPFGAACVDAEPIANAPPSPPHEEPPIELRLALASESAFGITERFFYNHLVGVRADAVFPGDLALGGALEYVNLVGKNGRASNALLLGQLEYRPRFSESAFGVPLRFATGYLPKNGPVLRTSAGLSFAASDDVEFALDVLAPTIWMVKAQALVSMDVALEISWRM